MVSDPLAERVTGGNDVFNRQQACRHNAREESRTSLRIAFLTYMPSITSLFCMHYTTRTRSLLSVPSTTLMERQWYQGRVHIQTAVL